MYERHANVLIDRKVSAGAFNGASAEAFRKQKKEKNYEFKNKEKEIVPGGI